MTFAQRFHSLMEERGWSNYRTAKEIGCHPTTVKNWLSGREPQNMMIPQIANVFDVSIEYLTGQTDEREQKETPLDPEAGGLNATDQAILDFLHSLPPKRLRGILVGLDAPQELLDALDREAEKE